MSHQHALFVCTTCASLWKDGKRVGQSGGEKLLEELQLESATWDLRDVFPLQPVECLSACSHACAVSFAATGKYTYVFGNLPAREVAQSVLTCATQYYARTDGLLPWSERPDPLKKGVLAKVPPLGSTSVSLHLTSNGSRGAI